MLNHKDKRLWTAHEKQNLIKKRHTKKELGMLQPFPISKLLIGRLHTANFKIST